MGVLAGLLVVTRGLTRHFLAEFWVVNLLGVVILLTGVLHVTTRISRTGKRGPPRKHLHCPALALRPARAASTGVRRKCEFPG